MKEKKRKGEVREKEKGEKRIGEEGKENNSSR